MKQLYKITIIRVGGEDKILYILTSNFIKRLEVIMGHFLHELPPQKIVIELMPYQFFVTDP